MKQSTQNIYEVVSSLGIEEKLNLYEILKDAIDAELNIAGAEEERPACPHCGSPLVIRSGKQNGLPRHRCKSCGKYFCPTTKSLLGQSKLPKEAWYSYARCMVDSLTLRECQKRCGVSLKTSFFMRHRLIECLRRHLPPFIAGKGCKVEIDETHVRSSFSGNHKNSGFKLPRPPRKRGGDKISMAGGRDHVCVMTGINEQGDIFLDAVCIGRMSADQCGAALAKHSVAGAIVSTDYHPSYNAPLKDAGVMRHVKIASNTRSEGVINMVNSLHSRFKTFIREFKGVSTKRLNNYLILFKWRELAKRTDARMLIVNQMANGHYETTWRNMWNLPYPFDMETTYESY